MESLPDAERDAATRTKFAVFVVHNKLKPKVKNLPVDIPVSEKALRKVLNSFPAFVISSITLVQRFQMFGERFMSLVSSHASNPSYAGLFTPGKVRT